MCEPAQWQAVAAMACMVVDVLLAIPDSVGPPDSGPFVLYFCTSRQVVQRHLRSTIEAWIALNDIKQRIGRPSQLRMVSCVRVGNRAPNWFAPRKQFRYVHSEFALRFMMGPALTGTEFFTVTPIVAAE